MKLGQPWSVCVTAGVPAIASGVSDSLEGREGAGEDPFFPSSPVTALGRFVVDMRYCLHCSKTRSVPCSRYKRSRHGEWVSLAVKTLHHDPPFHLLSFNRHSSAFRESNQSYAFQRLLWRFLVSISVSLSLCALSFFPLVLKPGLSTLARM